MTEPWCVLLASRVAPPQHGTTAPTPSEAQTPAQQKRDPLTASLRRASTVTSPGRIAAVIAAPADPWRHTSLHEIGMSNLFIQPRHRGTAYEVLLALLTLESRIPPAATVLFLPVDHVVNDEEAMTKSLLTMAEWIAEEPEAVYLLGAVPQGPHDQLGYIVPWHDSMSMPSGVYEFVEGPDVNRARQLMSAGGLWNTFIFGGTAASLVKLFGTGFEATIADFRAALQSDAIDLELDRAYQRLAPADFSQDVLALRTDSLKVLRLSRCGWWPLKSPTLNASGRGASAQRPETHGGAQGHGPRE
jgi:mannose-1-phosphate guanylyltransferase